MGLRVGIIGGAVVRAGTLLHRQRHFLTIRRDGGQQESGPRELLEAVFTTNRKGLAMQRYKGLGGMNAEPRREVIQDNVLSVANLDIWQSQD